MEVLWKVIRGIVLESDKWAFCLFYPLQNDSKHMYWLSVRMSGNLLCKWNSRSQSSVVVFEKEQLALGSPSNPGIFSTWMRDVISMIESIGEKKPCFFIKCVLTFKKVLITLTEKWTYRGLMPRKGHFCEHQRRLPLTRKEYKALSDHYFPVSYLIMPSWAGFVLIDRALKRRWIRNESLHILQTLIKRMVHSVPYYEKTE
jgi:hypothetical protein